ARDPRSASTARWAPSGAGKTFATDVASPGRRPAPEEPEHLFRRSRECTEPREFRRGSVSVAAASPGGRRLRRDAEGIEVLLLVGRAEPDGADPRTDFRHDGRGVERDGSRDDRVGRAMAVIVAVALAAAEGRTVVGARTVRPLLALPRVTKLVHEG